ncbi:DNA primase [Methanomicrobiaceae archaeon CYW5]|uniref:DNA primase DnaG n=1 Tax=Methanovulcanius yangii TaxID=1789227 RepID=UPI0029CA63DD|nr:DNA primase DnaG [Methanovulcanius yangii]MBT8507681.1 DNA primase [Methanovulcanius yangii]
MHLQDTTKYLIHIKIDIEGVVEKSDVIGAIFGQTEGLLGDELDLRDLQRSGRIGRIDVRIEARKGLTKGDIHIASSLDKAETAILAASLETIERVGPCTAFFVAERIEDIRVTKRQNILERAKELLIESFDEGTIDTADILDAVRECSRIEKVVEIGEERLPAGPNVMDSDAILVVEGRADVINLLRYGIKNAIAVEGTHIPPTIVDLCKRKTTTAFFDGDRGGDLILQELVQITDVDYVAIAPRGLSVEDMSRKEIVKPLRNKVPIEFILDAKGAINEEVYHQRLSESEQAARQTAVERAGSAPREEKPGSIGWHMAQVRGQRIVRFLDAECVQIDETDAALAEDAMKATGGDIRGIVIDRPVDQKFLDQAVAENIAFIAAPEFTNIVKKPVSISLLKFG